MQIYVSRKFYRKTERFIAIIKIEAEEKCNFGGVVRNERS